MSERLHCIDDKKTHFGTIWQNPWGNFPNFLCECALWSHTYSPGFIQIRSGLGSYNRKTLSATPKVILIKALWAHDETNTESKEYSRNHESISVKLRLTDIQRSGAKLINLAEMCSLSKARLTARWKTAINSWHWLFYCSCLRGCTACNGVWFVLIDSDEQGSKATDSADNNRNHY